MTAALFVFRAAPPTMKPMVRPIAILGILMIFTGCGGPTRSYQVTVQNDSKEPVTVWLTKSGGPVERHWRAPEHYGIAQPGLEDPVGGVIIDPGEIGSTPKLSGRFPGGTDAVLRVYLGARTLSELLSISRGSPNRIDVVLTPGDNDLVVRDRDGRIVVEPTAAAAKSRP